jgi:hypothetical protein
MAGQPIYTGDGDDAAPLGAFVGDGSPAGTLLGRWPMYCDMQIPTTNGADTEDVVIILRASEVLLFESEPKLLLAVEPLSGTLQARLQLDSYAAMCVMNPTGVCVVPGGGLAGVSGFS